VRRQFFPLIHCEVRNLDLRLLSQGDGSARDVMGLPERDLPS
jgi:hypothetical protein